jgi:hypothetical protein
MLRLLATVVLVPALALSACGSGSPHPTVAPAVADKCAVDADCGAGAGCAADVPGGGYCTVNCASAPCPSGSACVSVGSAGKLCLKTCTNNATCRPEHLCFASTSGSFCLPKCTQDADCASANCNLATGVCDASRVGNTCAADAACGQKPAFCDTSAAGGYCSLPCGGGKNVPCPDGANCASVGGGSSVCLLACTAGSCRTGLLCADTGGGLTSCVPKCTSNLGCGTTSKCDLTSGSCVPGGPAAGQLGGACGGDPDCAAVGTGAFCGTYPGGYCSLDCTAGQSVCGAAGTCVDFGRGVLSCLSKCTAQNDCRKGYACYPLGGSFGSVCTPACTSTSCTSPQVCDGTSGLCVTPAAGSGATLDIKDLTPGGPINVPTNSLTAQVSVTVPADAISVTFVGQATDFTARIVAYRIESPDGRLYDYASTNSVMKVQPAIQPGSFAVLAPNSPSVPFSPGTWTVTLLADKPTTATVKALIKRTTIRPIAVGSIDLNFFFVGLPNLSAATAQTDASFKTLFDTVKGIWSSIGISVGKVAYLDASAADASRFRDLNDADLGALVQTSSMAGANDAALNVFFVRTITSGSTLSGYIILGESAGIPGVPIRGTTSSGMAVTMADFPNGVAEIADTLAHEGGHWLGLFHPTESAGTAFDPIPDTPECAASAHDANNDHIMTPQECVGFGADNEMFWTSVSSIAHSKLTPNQQFVLLRSPAVH